MGWFRRDERFGRGERTPAGVRRLCLEVGQQMRARRQAMGMSLEKLAARAGLGVGQIKAIEEGQASYGEEDVANLLALAGQLSLELETVVPEIDFTHDKELRVNLIRYMPVVASTLKGICVGMREAGGRSLGGVRSRRFRVRGAEEIRSWKEAIATSCKSAGVSLMFINGWLKPHHDIVLLYESTEEDSGRDVKRPWMIVPIVRYATWVDMYLGTMFVLQRRVSRRLREGLPGAITDFESAQLEKATDLIQIRDGGGRKVIVGDEQREVVYLGKVDVVLASSTITIGSAVAIYGTLTNSVHLGAIGLLSMVIGSMHFVWRRGRLE